MAKKTCHIAFASTILELVSSRPWVVILAGSPSAAAALEATPLLIQSGTDISAASWSEPEGSRRPHPA